MCKLVVAGENTPPVLAINSLDKAFHFPKFQAKYFFSLSGQFLQRQTTSEVMTNVDY